MTNPGFPKSEKQPPLPPKKRPLKDAILGLLLQAGWAPVAVLIFHRIIIRTHLRTALDFTIHFSGGAAMAFFFLCALGVFRRWLGELTRFCSLLFSFSLACTIGVFWEFFEFFCDTYWKSGIQQGLQETMGDLIADASGAATALLLIQMVRWLRGARRPSQRG